MEKAKKVSKIKKKSYGSEEHAMSQEEFEEVMDLEEIELWKEESDAAKGRVENLTQTPANLAREGKVLLKINRTAQERRPFYYFFRR